MRQAFSLLELLIVVALIGLLVALILPHYSSFQRGKEYQTDIQRILEDLRWAREAALAQQADYVVAFNCANSRYAITTHQTDPATGEEDFYVASDNYALRPYDPAEAEQVLATFNFQPEHIQITEVSCDEDKLTFTSEGKASFTPAADEAAVTVKDEQGANTTIINVTASTGLVSLP